MIWESIWMRSRRLLDVFVKPDQSSATKGIGAGIPLEQLVYDSQYSVGNPLNQSSLTSASAQPLDGIPAREGVGTNSMSQVSSLFDSLLANRDMWRDRANVKDKQIGNHNAKITELVGQLADAKTFSDALQKQVDSLSTQLVEAKSATGKLDTDDLLKMEKVSASLKDPVNQ